MPTKKCGKATVLPTAPAYSFGTRSSQSLYAEPGPSPADYAPTFSSSAHKKSPGFYFGSSCRDYRIGDISPGAAEYNPTSKFKGRDSQKYTLASHLKDDYLRPKTPGPGVYDWTEPMDKIRHSVQSKTIGEKFPPNKESERRPGPHEYDAIRVGMRSAPAASLKFRHPEPNPDHAGPGPGQYAKVHRPPSRNGSSYTFGVSRSYRSPDNGVPGPGAYCCDCSSKLLRASSPAISIGKATQRPNYRDDDKPAPNAYFTADIRARQKGYAVDSGQRSSPAVGFTSSSRPYQRLELTPAPGDYPANDSVRKSAPAYSLHGVTPKDHSGRLPGPGHYHPEQADSEVKPNNPGPVIATRLDPSGLLERRPGPAEYDPIKSSKDAPGVSLKFRHEFSHSADEPGPQDYNPKLVGEKPAFSMGKKLRVKDIEITPGPGQYDTACDTLGVAARDVCQGEHYH